jgi:uncharacterized protein (DUF1697 family)
MEKYVALLRGINVGGHKKVPMKELKEILEKQGFRNVKTLLASGNVVFESPEENTREIPAILEKAFGFTIPTIIVPFRLIEEIVLSEPFKTVTVTQKTRLYVTFLNEDTVSKLPIPFQTADHSFRILELRGKVIFSVLDLEKTGTIDGMNILEKEFGKNLTTRNINTVEKISKL